MINSAIPSHAAASSACPPRERGLHLLLQTSNPSSSHDTTIPTATTESILQNDVATLSVQEVNDNQDYPNNHERQQQHSSSLVRHLSQSLVAFSEAGRVLDIVGRRAIQLGVEDVRSRIDPAGHRQRGRECDSDIEQPPAKRRCTTSNQDRAGNNGTTRNENAGKSISSEDMTDAQRIHRMATLVAQMREIQTVFVNELETFASRVEARKALEQDQNALPALGLTSTQESSPRAE